SQVEQEDRGAAGAEVVRLETVDDQAAHGRAALLDDQPVDPGRRRGPAQFDLEDGVIPGCQGVGAGARLAVAVDGHRVDDHGQFTGRVDGVDAGAGDVEVDEVQAAGVGVVVGVGDGLAQRAGAAVAGVGYGEDGQQAAFFQHFHTRQ